MSGDLCADCPLPWHRGAGVTRCESCPYHIPPELDAMAGKVLSYKPKPKSKPAKARKRRAAKIAKGTST